MSSRIVACRSPSFAKGGPTGAAATGTIAPAELLGNIKRPLQKGRDRCMLFVALNRTELRSRNESGFGVPRPTLTADSLLQRHSFVRFGGSTPSNPHGSIPVTVTSVPTLEICHLSCFVWWPYLEETVHERNTYVKLSGTFTHIRIRMRKNHH